MSTHVVTFFKHVLSCDGHLFKCPQKSFSIRNARSTDRAVEAAERLFERSRRIPHWTLHADELELKIDGRRVQFVPKHEPDARVRPLTDIPGALAK
jgi:hypothetical protein